MEHKQTEATITAVDEAQGIVEAVWAVMGNVDDVGDIIHPGAFTKTFNERGHQIKLLDNHRTDSVMASLGLVKELREVKRAELPQTMMDQYPDVIGGAWGRFQFFLDTPEGKGAFTRIQRGSVHEWSFGYDAVDKDYSKSKDGRPVRNLRGIKLYEVSPVLFPANSATTTTDAKATYANEEDEEDKAKWSTSYINNLPDSSFFLVESGGEKDEDGKTTPRSLRHLPYKDAEGNVDLPHLRNAISRLGQEGTGESGGEKWLTEAVRKRLLGRARGILEKEGGDKAINLSQQVEDVRQAFHAQYNSPNGPWHYWVNTVYDEYLIVCYESETGSEYYQIAYSQNGEGYDFAPMGEWVEGQYEFTPGGEKSFKAGRVLNARIAKRIIEAVDNLHQCLKDAGLMEMPEEEANTGPQKAAIPSTSDATGSQPELDGAGTDTDSSTRLLKLIELELEETEV